MQRLSGIRAGDTGDAASIKVPTLAGRVQASSFCVTLNQDAGQARVETCRHHQFKLAKKGQPDQNVWGQLGTVSAGPIYYHLPGWFMDVLKGIVKTYGAAFPGLPVRALYAPLEVRRAGLTLSGDNVTTVVRP